MQFGQVSACHKDARFIATPKNVPSSFDRVPFGYQHNLSGLGLFEFDSLCTLARKYDHDYFVATSAPSPGSGFYSVRYGVHTPYEALQLLDLGNQRILLKRPENYDARYGELMRVLFESVLRMRGGLGRARLVRLDSSILISSAAAITPFHFDPEVSFFFQIEGEKIYHLYTPTVLSEEELERFYRMGIVNIGQVDFDGRDPAEEHVFRLGPGKGMHQPQNSPHWVETQGSRSISYVFSFETDMSREVGRTRAFNYYMRKLGLTPSRPGTCHALDAMKAQAMQVAIPLRKSIAGLARKVSPR
jgi:hypothetical protein